MMKQAEALEDWAEVLADNCLQNLPYKIETNRFGQIVMSPANRKHSRYQGIIIGWLFSLKTSGEVYPKCPIATPDGVKVPDVAWISDSRLAAELDPAIFTLAPEVCIEVLSPSNRNLEIEQKKTLYFQQGAQEVWECDDGGFMRFFTMTAEIEESVLFPGFPKQL